MPVFSHDGAVAEALQRLRAAGEERDFEAAQMQLINLTEIIQGAGETWPQLKETIRATSTAFLKGCLEDDDIVIPAGDGFLLIFAQGDPDETRRRAEDLRALLLEFYLTHDDLKRLGIKLEHRQISARELRAMLASPPPPSTEPSPHLCQFAPVWSPAGPVIALYFCTPVRRVRDGLRIGYDDAYPEEGASAHRDYCELDLRLFDAAEAALALFEDKEARPAIGVSVHASTLQNRRARAIYLERLGRASAETMRHLFVKIAEVDKGAPTINLADWAGMLRARARNIMIEFHHSEAAPPNLLEVGALGAGYVAPPSQDDGDLAPVVRQLRRWGEALARQRVRFFVDRVCGPGLVRLAAEAGAHFITNNALWPMQARPGGVISAPQPAIAPFSPPQKTVSSPAN